MLEDFAEFLTRLKDKQTETTLQQFTQGGGVDI